MYAYDTHCIQKTEEPTMRIVRDTADIAYIDDVSFSPRLRPNEGMRVALELAYDYPADGFVTRIVLVRMEGNRSKGIECDDCLPTEMVPDGAIHIHAFDTAYGAPHEVYAAAASLLIAPHTSLTVDTDSRAAVFTLRYRSFRTEAVCGIYRLRAFVRVVR